MLRHQLTHQIKNIFNSARIIAKELGEVLSISHIKLVLSVNNSGLEAQRPQSNGVYYNGIPDLEAERPKPNAVYHDLIPDLMDEQPKLNGVYQNGIHQNGI